MTFPSRTLADVQQFTAFCKKNNTLSFQVQAFSEAHARVEALDKIGYTLFEDQHGTFYVVDADNQEEVFCKLKATSLLAAAEEGLTSIGWALSEPTDLIGGTMGSGFGIEEQ